MATTSMKFADGVEILGDITPAYKEILTPEAIRFLASLARRFESTRAERLAARVKAILGRARARQATGK